MDHEVYELPLIARQIHDASAPDIENQHPGFPKSLCPAVFASPLEAGEFFNQPTWPATVTGQPFSRVRWYPLELLAIMRPAQPSGRLRKIKATQNCAALAARSK
jgi:hypothetical protein